MVLEKKMESERNQLESNIKKTSEELQAVQLQNTHKLE